MRRRAAGFTLLEVLIALAILAVAAGATALALGGTHSRDADAAARRFTAQLQDAVDDALTGERYLAFVSDGKSGYHFIAWDSAKNRWIGETDRELGDDPELTGDDESRKGLQLTGLGPAGAINFRPEGESDAFSLILTGGDKIWKITSDGLNVTMASADAS